MAANEKNRSPKAQENPASLELIIIEDDQGIGKLIQTKLNRIGYSSKRVETGAEALNTITGAKNELLLVDYKLPDMSGKELILKLHEKFGYHPEFITLSGYGNEKTAVEMMRLGSRDYIVKEQDFLEILPDVVCRVCEELNNKIKLEETQEQLKRNLELLKETGEMARVGGWEVDLKTKQVYWTHFTKTIHEVPDDYCPELSAALDFFPGGARDRIEKAVTQAIERGEEYNLELPFITAKGKKLWVATRGVPQMENGECVRLHGTFQDISKRKQAELETKKKTAILVRTEQIAHVGSWDWEVETDTVTWSEELFRIFKLDPKKGAPSYAEQSKIYTPESMKRLNEAVQKCLKTGEPFALDLQIIRGDGKTAFCNSRGFARKDERGQVTQLFGSFQDITKSKEKEEKLKQLNRELTASKKSNEKLASSLSERLKELKCLYSIASIVDTSGISLAEILQKSVDFIPAGWQFPDKTFARILYRDQEYRTTPFHETKTKISHHLVVGNEKQGVLEIFLKDDEKIAFLKEEKELLFLISERLSKVIDRRETTKKLEETEYLLKETERTAKIGGWAVDPQTKRQSWTEEVFRILEIDINHGELQMSAGLNFIYPKYRDQAEQAIQDALKFGKPYDQEWLVTTAKGNKRWVNAVCLPKVIHGEVVRVSGSFQDITTRKEAEEKLKAANQQLTASEQQLLALNQQLVAGEQQLRAANQQLEANEQQLRAANQQLFVSETELRKSNETLKKYLDVAAEIVVLIDKNGKIVLLNASGHRILGYQPGELIGKDWFSTCLPIEERAKVNQHLSKLKKDATGRFDQFENKVITKTGERKIILWHNTLFRDDNGNYAGTLSSGEDFTERKAAEEKLIESEERFRKSQEAGHIGSWEYNLQTGAFWGSDEGKRIYNLEMSVGDFSTEEVMSLVVESDRDRVNQAMVDLVSNNKPYDIVFQIIPKGTSERKTIRSIAELQKDAEGNPLKVTGILQDITLQKMTEQQLIEAKEKAEEADRLKSAFLANMSHEIRTPMNGILGFTDLLKNPELSGDQQQSFIQIIHKSGNRMLDTVNAIIDISRIETGQAEVKLHTTNIKEEIEALHHFFSQEAKRKGLQLKIEKMESDQDFQWLTDRPKFNSILTNLIKNAIKFTAHGSINIACEITGKELHCYVQDTGIGIHRTKQVAVFNRFEQADIEDTRVFEGSGLGLAITKAYVEMLGGQIGLESEEGEGSKFWFVLPQLSGTLKKTMGKNEAEMSENDKSRKLKVIVAEDDDISAQYLSILLKPLARNILYATSGKETVALCKEHPDADLVLMDIKMPDGNGFEALNKIREFNPRIKIIAQTANALAGDREKALDAGFDDYVAKPVKKQDLIAKIEKHFQW